mmetsp:Transcript_12722/g.19283  ORF Transcript_12722/g.19283 Transcript_12722/m.19283 type:complete len:94 (+) Transcript_12722:157-438(+)
MGALSRIMLAARSGQYSPKYSARTQAQTHQFWKNPNIPKVAVLIAFISSFFTAAYAIQLRDSDKERMYRGVTYDVGRMNEKMREAMQARTPDK